MLLVFILIAAIWGIGAMMGVSVRMRWMMMVLLWIGVIFLHLVLAEDHALRLATGGEVSFWFILGGIVAMVWLYRTGLRYLHHKAEQGQKAEERPAPALFSHTELERYARHIVLREIGGPGQKALKEARILVVGAGGLGSPALLYLAAAGVGTIGVIDADVVDNSNLQRQIIHRDADIGMAKVRSAMQAMQAQNPNVQVHPYERRLTTEIAEDLFAEYDLVLDGTDNFKTRYLINAAAHAQGKPLISGALSQWEGQVNVFDPAQGTPCYHCIFPEAPAPELAPSCSEAGVLGPLPGVIGAMMATEAIKLITGAGLALRGEMLIYDALYGETRKIKLNNRKDCPVCGGNPADIEGHA